MRSFFKFAILFLFFRNVVFLSHLCAAQSELKIDENEEIHAMASNGELLAIVLPTKIIFYTMVSNSSKTLLAELFSIGFDSKLFDRDFNFELLPDSRFVLCALETCR